MGGAQKTKHPDGREEAQWPDGTKLWTDGKGHGEMTFPSGVREIYTPICKVSKHILFIDIKFEIFLSSIPIAEKRISRWNGQDGV